MTFPALERHKEKTAANKALTAKQKKALELKLKRLQDILDQRQAIQNHIYGGGGNPHAHQKQGISEKFNHLVSLTPEGVMGEMLAMLIFHFLAGLMHVEYFTQMCDFLSAQNQGIAYDQDENGNYPTIYRIEKGKVVDTDPVPANQVTRSMIRANGLVPPPSYVEALETNFAQIRLDMLGSSKLSKHDQELIYKRIEPLQEDARKNDEASDMASLKAMHLRQAQQNQLRNKPS